MNQTKYFVTGGVTFLRKRNHSIVSKITSKRISYNNSKFDPYTMLIQDVKPHEHGECYVTDDGAETDLDLGHERFFECANISS
jgi:CTP synthase